MIRRSCKTIQTDIAAIRGYLDNNPKIKINLKQEDIQDKKVTVREYRAIFLSTKVFESLIHSEVFAHFESETQTNLVELYYRIELNNDNISRNTDVLISKAKYPQSKQELQNVEYDFETSIADYQDELSSFLVKAEESIKNELQKIES